MISYYIYDIVTGEVVEVGQTTVAIFNAMTVGEGLAIEQGRADLSSYVKNGVLKQRPAAPSENHIFNYATEEYELFEPALAASVRQQRDLLLQRTDWTQLPDVAQTTRAAYLSYRQQLRDIPQQPGFPLEVEWPNLPE